MVPPRRRSRLWGAQYNLGVAYYKGQGVPQDNVQAVKWYRHAADQGFAQAQFNLGNMFRAGEGVPQDKEQALTLYKQAAEQGLAQAQANLGVMYYQGTGVLQDYVYAHMWLNIAVSNGNKRARKLRETITQISSPNQIEKVQALARECVRKNYQGC